MSYILYNFFFFQLKWLFVDVVTFKLSSDKPHRTSRTYLFKFFLDSRNWKRTIICHQAKHSAIVYFLSPLRKYVCKYACVCVCGVYLSQQNNAVINGICCLKGVLFDFMLNFFLLFFHFVWPEGIFCSKLCAKHAHTHPCIYTYTYLYFFLHHHLKVFFILYFIFCLSRFVATFSCGTYGIYPPMWRKK